MADPTTEVAEPPAHAQTPQSESALAGAAAPPAVAATPPAPPPPPSTPPAADAPEIPTEIPPLAPPPPDDPPECDCEEGAPAWVMTFGDLMSLLLTFFILLYSMSSTDAAKFQAAAQSLREALGEKSGELTSAALVPTEEDIAAIVSSARDITEASMALVEARLADFVAQNDLEESVDVVRDATGVYLRMQDQGVFAPGSARISPEAADLVDRLGQLIQSINIPVVVSGHTDDVPISTAAFASNWELSAARAAGIARVLVASGHGADAVSVEAFGEHAPIADNATPEGRAQNRRVELFYAKDALVGLLEERGLIQETPPGALDAEQARGSVDVISPAP